MTTIIIFCLVFLALDFYVFRGLKISFPLPHHPKLKLIASLAYWTIPLFLIGMATWFMSKQPARPGTQYILAFTGVFILFYIPKIILLVFNLLSDAWNGVAFLIQRFQFSHTEIAQDGLKITRGDFFRIVGTIVAILPLGSILYGILFGRFNYKTERLQVSSNKLNGLKTPLKVVQISDAHLGSFLNNTSPVEGAIDAINALNPDLILFTGDLVNDKAEEAEFWIPSFKKLKAKYGKYSVLGNHDYGDYVKWDSAAHKKDNLDRLKEIHSEMGFNLLLNRSEVLDLEGTKINLIGVENWGLPPFPQLGDLALAQQSADPKAFSILLSHDPTHFDEKVVQSSFKPELTLSGHTHGMQFGLLFGSFKWSPVQYRYKKWAGLYKNGEQKLYVNRGFGYIGFPGRVGMPPEITLIELHPE